MGTSKPMQQNIFIIGARGNVGSTLVRQIYNKRDTDASIHANPTRVVGLASATSCLVSKKGISKKAAFEFLSDTARAGARSLEDIVPWAQKNFRDLVFVDVTALNAPMISLHTRIIEKTPFS